MHDGIVTVFETPFGTQEIGDEEIPCVMSETWG
jgi:hypothetical protein